MQAARSGDNKKTKGRETQPQTQTEAHKERQNPTTDVEVIEQAAAPVLPAQESTETLQETQPSYSSIVRKQNDKTRKQAHQKKINKQKT